MAEDKKPGEQTEQPGANSTPPAPGGDTKKPVESKPKAEKYFVISIGTTNDPMGDVDAQVGVNGRMWRIRRGYAVAVPESVVEVLKNGVQTRYFETKNKHTGEVEQVARKVRTYPFQEHSQHRSKEAAEKAAAAEQAELDTYDGTE